MDFNVRSILATAKEHKNDLAKIAVTACGVGILVYTLGKTRTAERLNDMVDDIVTQVCSEVMSPVLASITQGSPIAAMVGSFLPIFGDFGNFIADGIVDKNGEVTDGALLKAAFGCAAVVALGMYLFGRYASEDDASAPGMTGGSYYAIR